MIVLTVNNIAICLLKFMFAFLMLKANIQVCLADVHCLYSMVVITRGACVGGHGYSSLFVCL